MIAEACQSGVTPSRSFGCFTGSSVWGDGRPAQKCMFICLLVRAHEWPHTSVLHTQIAGLLPRLCLLQFAQCTTLLQALIWQVVALCCQFITSAWCVRPGVDRIWISHWCCHITSQKAHPCCLTRTHAQPWAYVSVPERNPLCILLSYISI